MTYFDCFVVGSWMFAMGWFFGAVYIQNQATETVLASVELKQSARHDRWQVLTSASAAAD